MAAARRDAVPRPCLLDDPDAPDSIVDLLVPALREQGTHRREYTGTALRCANSSPPCGS
ncbi:hypothetical protein [Streptomyces shenzhenensis]|uniref:hypothetical protein n=1 Tax=Streptomyces shenzhenensis TaxID=943815 RepID=UPI001F21A2D2|nr:hypothetical protein [Streptomyces shenzhenensis]